MENNEQQSPTNEKNGEANKTTAHTVGEKVIQPLSSGLSNANSQNTEVDNKDLTPDVSNVYPEAVNSNINDSQSTTNYIAGSQMTSQKLPLPKGIYIITALNLLGFIAGFFDTSQAGSTYTAILFFDLLLAIGLLLRFELARKLIVVLSVATILFTSASLILLIGLQDRVQQRKIQYETAISKIDKNRLTTVQKKQLEEMTTRISIEEERAGKSVGYTYTLLTASMIISTGTIIYLTRPKVKSVFHGLTTDWYLLLF